MGDLPQIQVLKGEENVDLWLEDIQDVVTGLEIEDLMAGEIPEPPKGHRSRSKYRTAIGALNLWLSSHMDNSMRRELQMYPEYPSTKPWQRIAAVKKLLVSSYHSSGIEDTFSIKRKDYADAKDFVNALHATVHKAHAIGKKIDGGNPARQLLRELSSEFPCWTKRKENEIPKTDPYAAFFYGMCPEPLDIVKPLPEIVSADADADEINDGRKCYYIKKRKLDDTQTDQRPTLEEFLAEMREQDNGQN